MRRILVTGASGFIGRHVVAALRESGVEPHIAGRHDPGIAGTVFHALDLFDRAERVQDAIAKVDASHLVHLAWDFRGSHLNAPGHLDWIGPSILLLRAFAESGGRRAVFVGSALEYGAVPDPKDEFAACAPTTLYGIAKDTTRRACEGYAKVAGLSLAWARLFFTYGPGDRPGRLVPAAIDSLLAGQRFAATGGTQHLDMSHVRDVAAALVALTRSTVTGPVNIGSSRTVTVRALLEKIAHLTGAPELVAFGALSDPSSHLHASRAKIDRLVHDVGFRPRIDIDAGLADTVEWHRRRT